MNERDRRAPGATRIPFEAMVEVGAALGPSFEAQAVNLSGTGMHLRTAYLPEVGQPLTCRFEAGPTDGVLASGEVVWTQEASRGGEFGIRFTDLDGASASTLRQLLGAAAAVPGVGDANEVHDTDGDKIPRATGAKVRLHIDGLGSPMRARIKGANHSELTVGSELGFLQVGKELELEDTETGAKRAARIDRVEVEIDPTSRVPQLVVALRYSDDEDEDVEIEEQAAREATPGPCVTDEEDGDERDDDDAEEAPMPAMHAKSTATVEDDEDQDDLDAMKSAGERMKGSIARGAAKITPAFEAFAKRAKTTFALMAAKRFGGKKDDVAIPVRRVTAPPPAGGLHASGRKVVRDSMPPAGEIEMAKPMTKGMALVQKIGTKRVVMGGVGMAVLAIGLGVAMHKPSEPPAAPVADTAQDPNAPGAAAGEIAAAGIPAATAAAPVASGPTGTVPGPVDPLAPTGIAVPPPVVSDAAPIVNGGSTGDEGTPAHKRKIQVPPFSNGGPLAHGNVLRLKMDGAIEKLQGAPQPTGFTVVVPNRRSLEAAAPLAARDARIASIKVANDGSGAELSVTFKDGVPNYMVRAKNDVLEIVLAPVGGVASATPPAAAPGARAAEQHPTASAKQRKHAAHKH